MSSIRERLLTKGFGRPEGLFGQFGGLLLGHHPANDIAAEDVEDDVEMEAGAPDRTLEFGDVPAPHLVRRHGQ